MSKLNQDFARMRDAELEAKTMAVMAAMKDNPDFPNPVPALAEVTAAQKNFSDALAAAKTRDKVKVSIKNDMRKVLVAVLVSLANYVSFVANGVRSIQAGSGFTVSAERASSTALGAIRNFLVEMGPHSGEVVMSIGGVSGARAYLFLYRDASITGDAWLHVLSSYSSMALTGLDPMKVYSFRIGVIGAKDQAAYTDIITKTVV